MENLFKENNKIVRIIDNKRRDQSKKVKGENNLEEKKNNMLTGFHIKRQDENGLVLQTKKMYKWFIPKALRDSDIQKGDIVLVRNGLRNKKGLVPVLVMDVYRQELEEHEKVNKPILEIKERAPRPAAITSSKG